MQCIVPNTMRNSKKEQLTTAIAATTPIYIGSISTTSCTSSRGMINEKRHTVCATMDNSYSV